MKADLIMVPEAAAVEELINRHGKIQLRLIDFKAAFGPRGSVRSGPVQAGGPAAVQVPAALSPSDPDTLLDSLVKNRIYSVTFER